MVTDQSICIIKYRYVTDYNIKQKEMVALGRIKSSLELAMERLKKKGEDGAGGKTFNEAQPYLNAATVLGRSFLQGKTTKEEIGEKLGRYPEQSRIAAVQAFIRELAAKMVLENTPMVLEAIRYLMQDEKTEEICTTAEKLYRQFEHMQEEKLALLTEDASKKLRGKLSHAGIRGSAIAGFNVEGSATWQQARDRIGEEYARSLKGFRSSIIPPEDAIEK
jgi:hypothetical protein